MSLSANQVNEFDYVIFGATGDLTMRKLLPALYHRFRAGQIPSSARIIGTARSPLSHDTYRDRARDALNNFIEKKYIEKETVERFLGMVFYVSLNGAEADSHWDDIKGFIAQAENHESRVRVFYLATAPKLYGTICENLKRHGLVTDCSRVVLEKPIGTDRESANAINDAVGRVFPENHIFRIDHYLGKEMVQNILAFRFANPLFDRIWSSDAIDYVQITALETVGVGSRGPYYDTSGAMRDMIQNHLLQVLCLVAMDPPGVFVADALRNEKLKILRALKPITADDVQNTTVRAQYVDGQINGQLVPAYLTDLGENSRSQTETFAALKTEVNTLRWGRVPFYLRTGKRMAKRLSEVVVQLKPVTWSIFPTRPQPNRIVLRIQPDEGVKLSFTVKDSAPAMPDNTALRTADIGVSFQESFNIRYPDSYEQLLIDTIKGDPTLFIRRDEVDAAWAWADPILKAWQENLVPLSYYPAGSWGPSEAEDLLRQQGHQWHEDDF